MHAIGERDARLARVEGALRGGGSPRGGGGTICILDGYECVCVCVRARVCEWSGPGGATTTGPDATPPQLSVKTWRGGGGGGGGSWGGSSRGSGGGGSSRGSRGGGGSSRGLGGVQPGVGGGLAGGQGGVQPGVRGGGDLGYG